jgi:hypothetical protein
MSKMNINLKSELKALVKALICAVGGVILVAIITLAALGIMNLIVIKCW